MDRPSGDHTSQTLSADLKPDLSAAAFSCSLPIAITGFFLWKDISQGGFPYDGFIIACIVFIATLVPALFISLELRKYSKLKTESISQTQIRKLTIYYGIACGLVIYTVSLLIFLVTSFVYFKL